jgi:hypothetical protein
MPSKSDSAKKKQKNLPKITADYGGRREMFDRRWHPEPIDHPERRTGKERRSGFDRRSSLPPDMDNPALSDDIDDPAVIPEPKK